MAFLAGTRVVFRVEANNAPRYRGRANKMETANKLDVFPTFESEVSRTLKPRLNANAVPRPVWHTFRVDASFEYQRRITGIGLILRATNKKGRDGQVLATFCEAYIGFPDGIGEPFAVLRALEIAAEAGYRLVRVRSDYNSMRRALKEAYQAGRGQDWCGVQGKILRLAREFDQVKFAWIARRKNHEAHRLARRGVHQRTATVREDIVRYRAPGGLGDS
jgi:ribonuclease HI